MMYVRLVFSAVRKVIGQPLCMLREYGLQRIALQIALQVGTHLTGPDIALVTGPVSYTHLTLPTNREV